MSDEALADRKAYVNDPRIACKYGPKCYQKNPVHLQKYKHPPPKRTNAKDIAPPPKKFKQSEYEKAAPQKRLSEEIDSASDDDSKDPEPKIADKSEIPEEKSEEKKNSDEMNDSLDELEIDIDLEEGTSRTPKHFDHKEFIKQKFLVTMPDDFYAFWELCKKLKEKCPQEAFKDVGLYLVGPYDVLAGKFNDIPEKSDNTYLIHWRYYYDPPEVQTVLRGDDKNGYHIGYFRDSPNESPVFLVSNCAKVDGVLKRMGDNIFAAVYLYMEEVKKTGDPFKRMHVQKLQNAVKEKAEKLNLTLSDKTQMIRDRDKKAVAVSFSKIGIVVPYNRKTQLGYRDLGITKKELQKILDDIKNALPEQRQSRLSKLQDILTNVSIATDECDFGTGIELGLDILAHGVDSLNLTIARFLSSNYRLIDREAFAKIAEAHMKNRRQGTSLSVV